MSEAIIYRPCRCDSFRPGEPFTEDQCRTCWLYHDRGALGASYRALWAAQKTTASGSHGHACRHLGRRVREEGDKIKQRLRDTGCCGPKLLDVFVCRHKTYGPETTLADCHGCPGYVTKDAASPPSRTVMSRPGEPLRPANLTPETPVAAVTRLLATGPDDYPAGWAGWENVRLAHIHLLEEAIDGCRPYPAERNRGRGIVTCASAKPGWSSGKNLPHGYFPGAWVLINELRRLGCTLPITFAHLGPAEWDSGLTRLIKPLGAEVLDLREAARRDPMRILAGWESKVFAVQQAPYEEVLFLDADNVPARDPAFLFDHPQYRQRGAIFWPDLPPCDRSEWIPDVVWHNIGLAPRNSIDFESGQLLIDKRRCWRELMAARHINEHSDWYYKFVFGDKSTFHLAWSKCGTAWAMPETPAGWMGGSILQHDFEGRVLFYHACQDKPSLAGYSRRGYLPNEAACDGHLAELRRLWPGRLWVSDNPAAADRAVAARLRGQSFDYHRVGLDRRRLDLLEGGRVGCGGARCEFGWSVLDGVLAVVSVEGAPTFLARECAGGVWRGSWLEHERCEVVLTPLPCDELGKQRVDVCGDGAAMATA
jgi:hypothetical protein